jgi:cytochrome c
MSSDSRWWRTLCFTVGIAGWSWIALVPQPARADAFDAAATFDVECSGCHSVGKGEVVGPDLRGVTARRDERWLRSFIRSSQSVIHSGDPTAVALFQKYQKRMPDHDFTDGEIHLLLGFIAAGGPRPSAGELRPAHTAKAAEVALGHKLFTGAVALQSGGAPCAHCHTAVGVESWSGGTLASDLTRVFVKYRDAGLTRALAESRLPLMECYRERPLTHEEIFALKAFLYRTSRSRQPAGQVVSPLIALVRSSPFAWLTHWIPVP